MHVARKMNLAIGRLYVEPFDRDVRVDPTTREIRAVDPNDLGVRSSDERISQGKAVDHEIDRRVQRERLAGLRLRRRLSRFAEHDVEPTHLRIHDMNAHAEQLEQCRIQSHLLDRDIESAHGIRIAKTRERERTRNRTFARFDVKLLAHCALCEVQCGACAHLSVQNPQRAEHDEHDYAANRS